MMKQMVWDFPPRWLNEDSVDFAYGILPCSLCTSSNWAEKIQHVGGDFGRAWLSNYQAQNPKPTAQDSEDNLSSWGGAPKGNASVSSNLLNQQTATNLLGQDWLDVTTPLGIENNTKNNSTRGTMQEFPSPSAKLIVRSIRLTQAGTRHSRYHSCHNLIKMDW